MASHTFSNIEYINSGGFFGLACWSPVGFNVIFVIVLY